MADYTMIALRKPDRDGHRFYAEWAETADPDFRVISAWCIEHFGPRSAFTEGSRWCGDGSYWFRDEIDALQFKLRWC